MEVPNLDIPLLPLEPSPSAQDSVSAQHESISHRTSRENISSANSISDAPDGPTGVLLPLFSTEENGASLKTGPESSKNMVQIVWGSICYRLPEGWRFGVTIGAILSLCTLIGNIIVFAIVSASVDTKDAWSSTVVTIREGHCSDMEHIQLGIHLIINVVSTILLGASNYCMQCLSAPTRAEVDREHKKGRFLDIGVPSLRNLLSITKERAVCWCILCISSLPLHLIYNSTFFVALTNNSYDIYIASHDFQNGKWFDNSLLTDYISTSPSAIQEQIQGLGLKSNGSIFERLDNADCIEAYAKTPLPDRRTLVLVSSTLPRDNLNLGWTYILKPDEFGNCRGSNGLPIYDDRGSLISCLTNSSIYTVMSYRGRLLPEQAPNRDNWFYWICSQKETYREDSPLSIPPLCGEGHWQTVKSNASEWTVYGFKIDYCISERLESECNLNMSGHLLIVVILFNAIKTFTMIFVIRRMHGEHFMTIGDATASFIEQPDPITKGVCLYAREDFHKGSGIYQYCEAKPFKSGKKRRATAASRQRWISVIILILASLALVLGLLGFAITDLKKNYRRGDFDFLSDLGLGTVSGFTLIQGWALPTSGDAAVISAALVANSPQVLFSVLYVFVNSLFTKLSLAAEWSRYAHRNTPLRVSKQRGSQRSTYFLQIPYRLAIPLMTFSAFLHWIMSQSFFFSQVDARNSTGGPSKYPQLDGPTTCGYSPNGMIITAIAGFGFLIFVAALGWRKLRSEMPVAGSCSLAISAACHSPEGTSALLPVMWGVIPDIKKETEEGNEVGHCAFSNGPVEPLVEGHLYA